MTSKTKNIINWVLAGLVGIIFLGSAMGKLMGSPDALKMAEGFGISATAFKTLGVIELLSVILFIYPRTGILGTLLLAAYMGGAIASHLEHGLPIMAPIFISAFVWIAAVVRFPELRQRILNS
ncbi:MAG TPA: DoxX family protein [Puia sp.]|nr:DoxX family protein [Puia sp.]